MPTTPTINIHIGSFSPSRWGEIDAIRAVDNPRAFGDEARPLITVDPIDWAGLGITPRWVGDDSSEAVVAVDPSLLFNRGAQEWQRFLAGAANRSELALALSVVGSAAEPEYVGLNASAQSVSLPGSATSSVGGERLVLGSAPELAPGLGRADRDLAVRIAGSRLPSLPWWQLQLYGSVAYRGDGGERTVEDTEGELSPLLVSTAGEVVAAIWTSPDGSIGTTSCRSCRPTHRYWTGQYIAQYLNLCPPRPRRLRRTLVDEPALQTTAESRARADLAKFEADTEVRRTGLAARVRAATSKGEPVRDSLLYGSGTLLVEGVALVLRDAGIEVQDLDELLGATSNADLLATFMGQTVLIEVKSTGGNAAENLTEAARRHLATWPQLRPDIAVTDVVLVINHQTRTHPLDRSPAPYARREFVASVQFPVLSSMQLFDWWRTEKHDAVRAALFPQHRAIQARDPTGTEQAQPALRRRSWMPNRLRRL